MAVFIAEQFWPDVTAAQVAEALRNVCAADGGRRLLEVVHLIEDESVMYVIDGDHPEDVGALVARSGRDADRIQRCQRFVP